MTFMSQRTALILLAGTALSICAAPQFAVGAPLVEAAAAEPAQALAAPGVDAFARARARGPAATYTVKKGDNLGAIAGRMGVDIDDLAKANGLKKPYRLQPGQVLKNPKAAPKARAPEKAPAKAASGGGETYTVQRGDTLFSIAQRLGTTVAALQAENGMGRGTSISAGQKLRAPGSGAAPEQAESAEEAAAPPERRSASPPRREAEPAPTPPPAAGAAGRVISIETPGRAYKVKKGDTLERVAGRLDSDVAELARINKLKKPYRIHPGQTIRGPGGSAKAYVAVRGDTLAGIAGRFGVTAEKLRAANGLRRGAAVKPGQRLRLPAGYRDGGATRTPEPQPPYAPPPVSPTPAPARSAQPGAPIPSSPQPYRPSVVQGAPVASPAPSDAQITELGRGRFIWPLRGDVLSTFGAKGTSQRNDGVNIRAEAGAPVHAAAAGDVVYAGDQVPGFGNLVLIKHADGWVTAYGHLGRVNVRMQEHVEQGQEIGEAGSTGGVSEPQLHFEVRFAPTPQERARPIDPALVLPR